MIVCSSDPIDSRYRRFRGRDTGRGGGHWRGGRRGGRGGSWVQAVTDAHIKPLVNAQSASSHFDDQWCKITVSITMHYLLNFTALPFFLYWLSWFCSLYFFPSGYHFCRYVFNA